MLAVCLWEWWHFQWRVFTSFNDAENPSGHNLIGMVGIAAALGFKAVIDELHIQNARIKVFGTPGEEAGGGKINMIDHGAFDDVDVALMGHGGNKGMANQPFGAFPPGLFPLRL